MKKELGIFILLLVLCGVTSFENHRFLSAANLINTSNVVGLFGIFSIGLGLVIITGGIDLSVGSMIALSGMLLVMALTQWNWNWRSWDVSSGEIKDMPALIKKFNDGSNPVSQYLMTRFGGDLQSEIKNSAGQTNGIEKLPPELASALNLIIHGDSIYQEKRFVGIDLSDLTKSFLGAGAKSGSPARLNRLLLEDAYSPAIAKAPQHWPWPLAVLFVLAVPMALGWVHGFLITRFKLQPFIVTLCALLIYRGAARYISHDVTLGFGDCAGFEKLRDLANGSFLGLPMTFVILITIAVIMWFVLHRSVYGRYLYAVGRNEEAARFSGINTRRVITGSYMLAGLLTGISAILFAFYTNLVSPSTHGNFYELYGIAAAVLGGCSLRGGEGSIIGILIGTALLQVLQNLVNLLGIDSSLNFAVMGAVVLVGVLADQIVKNRSKKGARG